MVRKHAPVRERHPNYRAQPLPVAARSLELEGQPVPGIGGNVAVELRRSVQDGHHHIDPSVVVEIGKRRPVVERGLLKILSRAGGDIGEALAAQIAENLDRKSHAAPDEAFQVGKVG